VIAYIKNRQKESLKLSQKHCKKTFSNIKNIFTIILIMSIFPNLMAENHFYFSPGVKFGYIFGKGFTMGLKMSIGIFHDDGTFVNITFGGKGSITKKNKFDYHFIELQAGFPTEIKTNSYLLSGGGLGIIIQNENSNSYISPKLNLFTGFLLFGEMNFYFNNKQKLMTDIGIEGVLPIPFKGLNLGLN
jgi:hypothetical protein